MKKSIIIFGLDNLGRHLAQTFSEHGNDVLAIDIEETKINEYANATFDAHLGDATMKEFVEELGVNEVDLCFVTLGDRFKESLECVDLLKSLDAKKIIARAHDDSHAKFLCMAGADKVVYAEKELAESMAVAYSANNVFEYISLSNDYGIYDVAIPDSWVGKTIAEIDVRRKYEINIIGFKREQIFIPVSNPNHVFIAEEQLTIVAEFSNVSKIIK
ncbi:MAG: TrkA family potassium uptake protein [Bacillota bacterium]|nr:TrkA family potassium uptake protein [Bacillota bacterium]